ncbi:DNA recombination protein RmuC [Mycoplasmopsis arginini]|uniref:DNA recombination protein RmuC n=1 Tax=Mycoplasmopsis arginini TaxID=2094 RepID=A0ABZ2AKN8_MYCAR|nr:DNA recombination protein RmuC [Mycoplasmopsis arginini]WVN22085.1 DNA recombination protein RmuC [Mycoplasmopsis arginini]VEU81487.1 RmuC family [Mycoplasmopsis arginini]
MNSILVITLIITSILLLCIIGLIVFLVIERRNKQKNNDSLNKQDEIKYKEYLQYFKESSEHLFTKFQGDQKLEIEKQINQKFNEIKDLLNNKNQEFKEKLFNNIDERFLSINNFLKDESKKQSQEFNSLSNKLNENIDKKIDDITNANKKWFEEIKTNIDKHFEDKLTKQINEHFDNIKTSMDEMNKGMTEFSTIQKSVTDLNKAFSTNKYIGNFGEFSLKQIFENHFPDLKDKLWFEQYNINSKNNERVDFAIKIKQKTMENEEVEQIIPIDSKLPLDSWNKYVNETNKELKEKNLKAFRNSIKEMAKSISDKYINVNKKTTPYALMFVPSEFIYSSILQEYDFTSKIWRDHRVFILGPTLTTAFIYNLFVQNQNFKVAKDIDKIRGLFVEIQNNYKNINNNIIESLKSVNSASDKIKIAYKNSRLVVEKINKNSEDLNIRKIEIKKDLEEKLLPEETFENQEK